MNTTEPQRVDFLAHRDDLKAATLGALGFSTKFISEETGFTPCQVNYRLGKAEVHRKDYRNGESEEAQRVLQRIGDVYQEGLKRRIMKKLKIHQAQVT